MSSNVEKEAFLASEESKSLLHYVCILNLEICKSCILAKRAHLNVVERITELYLILLITKQDQATHFDLERGEMDEQETFREGECLP
jgi:hypothetical protein